MAGGNRQSRPPVWRVTTVKPEREVHYPCDFKTCQCLWIEPVRIRGRLTEGKIKKTVKENVDDGRPHSSEYVKRYRQLSSDHCK